jgi:hypothetical protein
MSVSRIDHVSLGMLGSVSRGGMLEIRQLRVFCFFCIPWPHCVRHRGKAVIGLRICELETFSVGPELRNICSEIIRDSMLKI